jgi:hypothetical protein
MPAFHIQIQGTWSMEARFARALFVLAVLLCAMGAKYRTANFIVETADPRLAQQFAEAAEDFRSKLALSWLGEELPKWSQPCPVKVQVGPTLGAGGATTFTFDRGEVFGWNMNIQGSAERVLDSVLPHEITHMIYASHFRRPLPRWADEGGATSVEDVSERNKQRASLDKYLRTGRGIAFSKMFAMTEYPADVLPLYAQGYSTVEYLIQQGGRRRYIMFLDDALKDNDWAAALQKHYSLQGLGDLQKTWLAWVKEGSPLKSTTPVPAASPEIIAAAQPTRNPNDLVMHLPREKSPAVPGDVEALPRKPLVPVSDSPAASEVAGSRLAMASAQKSRLDAPYAPGSTIAVSKLSIPSTGWRASYTVASASLTTPSASDPYRTQVSRPQAIDSSRQTTMLR